MVSVLVKAYPVHSSFILRGVLRCPEGGWEEKDPFIFIFAKSEGTYTALIQQNTNYPATGIINNALFTLHVRERRKMCQY